MKRIIMLLVVMGCVVSCGSEPTPLPDLVATQVSVMEAAAATLTAGAPEAVPSQVPTEAQTAIPATTATVPPTDYPTATRPAPASPTDLPPSTGPRLGTFAVVNVASDDVLNVRSRPGAGQAIEGSIPYHGLDVDLYAGGRELDGSWWVPVRYGAVEGWANSNYLARQVGWTEEAVAARAAEAILALKERDLLSLAELVHPEKGVRLSPYTYVRTGAGVPEEGDLVFSSAQIAGLLADATIYDWGAYDGSGDPITLTFAEYYDRFIYDADFARPDIVGFDEEIGWSSMVNNIADVYPGAVTVEYHFEGFDPQYAGMDWRSLRLVLEEIEGSWYLVGIVHDEWTA